MNSNRTIRLATGDDVDFLTPVDLLDEGTPFAGAPHDFEEHRLCVQAFVDARAAAAWVLEVPNAAEPVGIAKYEGLRCGTKS